jgi:hypothetical protein
MAVMNTVDLDYPNFLAYQKTLNALISNPGNNAMGVIEFPVVADATAGINLPALPYDCKIVGVRVICDAANASGTLTLRSGTTSISSAMACAVLDTIADTTTILTAQRSQVAGTVLNVISIGGTTSATRGTVQLTVRRA